MRGGFLDLSADTTVAAMTQAVLEGVAYAFRDARDALVAAGTLVTEADLIGSGSHSAYWADVLANVLGMTLHLVDGSEHGCALGAARLARMAAEGGSVQAAKPKRLRSFEPRAALSRQYDEAFDSWRGLYSLLREVPHAPTT